MRLSRYYQTIIKEIDGQDPVTQRDIAKSLGFSLGKVNYLIKSLTEKGILKLENFKNSKNKLAYHYILTPNGIKEKFKITKNFLHRKEEEYEKMHKKVQLKSFQRVILLFMNQQYILELHDRG